MDNDHFISVNIGTHNNRNDILGKYAVQSVLQSKYLKSKFEVIIVDNNADQNIHADLVKKYSNNPQVKLGREDRTGICFVRNKGVELSIGDIICFTDDDCEVDPLWLNRINEFYQNRSIMFGGGSIYDTCLQKLLRKSKDDFMWEEERRIPGGNMSFRKELLKKFKFDENIIYGKDEFELIFRLLKEGYLWYFDEKPILHHRASSRDCDDKTVFNAQRRELESNSELYFKLKRGLYSKLYSKERLDWQNIRKKERIKIFFKYYFIRKKRYSMSLNALKRVEEDLNILLDDGCA